MLTLDRFSSLHLAASPAPDAAGGHQMLVMLAAVGLLFLTARFMWRSVGPVLEIIKAALYAVTSFVLIAGAVLLLLYAVVTR